MVLYSEKLPLGWKAADFSLPDTEERMLSLADFSDKKGLLIVFTCNHCPYARASWPLMNDLHRRYSGQISFVAINPNDEIAYPEDSFSEMKQKKVEWGIPFPYLRDETQAVARAYNAQCTPDTYLFKKEPDDFGLFYHGRINDNWQNPAQVKEKNLERAIEALIRDQKPPQSQPPSMGCSIKWKNTV